MFVKIAYRSNFVCLKSSWKTIAFAKQLLTGIAGLSLVTILATGWNCTVVQADLIFTDRAAFEAGLPVGFFTDNFSGAPTATGAPVGSYTNSGGTPTIGYTITAPTGGLFIGQLGTPANDKFIGPWEDTDDLLFTFNTANVYRVGIGISLEDLNSLVAGNVTIDFSSGASTILSVPATGDYSFVGIYSDVPLSSMTIRASGGGIFTNTSLLTTAVPEPSSAMMLALVSGSMLARRRRQLEHRQ